MISLELLTAISIYYVIMYATPGPNNSILTASGIKFGFVKTVPNILGIPTGHGIQLTLVCFGLGSLFLQFPFLLSILKYIGAAYLLYLAWKMFGSLKVETKEDKSAPLSYQDAIFFQFVNPKAWVICITAVSLFYPAKENIFVGTLFMVVMSTIINIPSISIWAIGGSIIRKYLNNHRFKKTIEWLLAFLLIGTAISIII
jgi:threonine/homoserine/homoserine lactone efflux protein|tara:strand:- start:256 stop:855 length:600 start_codon:yes stop_codon:yes gene_type:complete